jgi:histidyl-tRNA synthetase
LGFSYTLEDLLESMPRTPVSAKIASGEEYTLVVPQAPEAYTKALTAARDLRNGVGKVEMEVCGRSLEESLGYARSRGINTVVEVSVSGERTVHNLGTG